MQTRKWVTALLLVLSVCAPALAANNGAMKLFAEGFDLIGAGKLQEATAKFEKGLKSDPNNAMAHYYLAESYLGLKKADKAKIHYQRAVKLDPNGQAGKDAKARLAQMSDVGKSLKPGSELKDCPKCPVMVVVPPGQFVMGSPPNEMGRNANEGPPHIVRIARPFAVGKFEVTFDEWDACVAERGCKKAHDQGWGRGKRPVINVSWDQVAGFVKWLSGKTGKPYRLLSEAEWEYIARGGTTTAYWWGDQPSPEHMNSSGSRDQWKSTAPVGSFPANLFGLHDTHGNVYEWVEDCDKGSYEGNPTDGSAWTGCKSPRVARGGSWGSENVYLRSSSREAFGPSEIRSDLGFRVARELP